MAVIHCSPAEYLKNSGATDILFINMVGNDAVDQADPPKNWVFRRFKLNGGMHLIRDSRIHEHWTMENA
jgi:hypothetical protein